MKKYFVYAFALALIAFVAPRAFAKGALAIDHDHGDHYGWAVNIDSQESADHEAISHCGGYCHVVYRFEHTCAAYSTAEGPGHHEGWAHSDNEEEAKRIAVAECRSHGGHECVVRVWGCDK